MLARFILEAGSEGFGSWRNSGSSRSIEMHSRGDGKCHFRRSGLIWMLSRSTVDMESKKDLDVFKNKSGVYPTETKGVGKGGLVVASLDR